MRGMEHDGQEGKADCKDGLAAEIPMKLKNYGLY